MKHLRITSLFAAGTVALSACADQTTAPTRAQPDAGRSMALAAAPGQSVRSGAAALAAAAADVRFGTLNGAINEDDYVCYETTPLNDWFYDGLVSFALESEEAYAAYLLLYDLAADQIPMYYAWLFAQPGEDQYYGYNGEFTDVMNRTERDVKRFWDIPSAGIKVVPMHGTTLMDVEKVAATYRVAYGLPEPLATEYAQLVRETVAAWPKLNGGNFPWFTFNAVAFRSFQPLGLPTTVVMGDGIMEGYKALGYGDVAPQAIFAHEYAHQIQFANGYSLVADGLGYPGVTGAERTRYTELMADALSAYYLTHKRGAAMNKHRVAEFLQAFFQIGDCGFTSNNHHGTQNQRMAAAQFGFDVADQAQKEGHILTSAEFHALFVAQYPRLIAPDAEPEITETAAY